jgi:hypothetical protein
MKYQFFYTWNADYTPGSFRDYYKTLYGTGPCPVDRFNLLPEIDPQTVEFNNIVPDPIYNLSNLPASASKEWKDRYFSLFERVATDVYNKAQGKKIVVMYSGGIDSTAALIALMKHSRYKEFLDSGNFVVGLSTSSIREYPKFFYETILPTIPIIPADYNAVMCDPTTLVVTGDSGDYVIGNTDTPVFFNEGSTDILYRPKEILWPYLNNIDKTGKFVHFFKEICKRAPFEIYSVNQAYWWIGQAFVHQGEMHYPFCWSKIEDLSEVPTFNKVYRWFLSEPFMTFSFEYASVNPYYTDFNSARLFPKEYIVDYTKDSEYMNKIKIFSQRQLYREVNKTRVYEDGSWVFTLDKIKT